MSLKHRTLSGALLLATAGMIAAGNVMAEETAKPPPLVIEEQGSFAVGGTVVTNPGTFDPYRLTPEGQTLHGDHAYVFYQVPANARRLPLVLWHGAGQFGKTWETTADGREGYQTIFLRRGFKVYVIDQPRRGRAGRSIVAAPIPTTPDEQTWFDIFRIGVWPNYFEGVQFSRDAEPLSEFMQLTKIPIVIYFGDNIPEQPTANPGQDNWRVRLAMARLFRDAVNRRGGDVTLVHLPELGIRGNTHFAFSDLNNLE